MYELYAFVAGPMVWGAFAVCIGGLLWRGGSLYLLLRRNDRMIFSYLDAGYALRSVAVWSVPYATRSMRKHPVMTGVAFLFHICIIVTPFFLAAHVFMLDEALGIAWVVLDDRVADGMTLLVIGACVFFAARRMLLPEVRYVTDWTDMALLFLVALPFVTGYLAYHQIGDYLTMILLHILAAEVLLVAIPFTRLSHMLLAGCIRGYAASEFGGVRNVKDW